ncbi:MAG: PrgI family protein [Candidatus Saccharimonadales bacterium]
MATYTVIQDIEAEDKLVGPLSLRQFIYGAVAALCAYLSFVSLAKGAAFLIIIFGPVMLFTAFFAIPWVGNQPTEVWALAKIRFWLKPRRRIWDQSGVKDLVTITVPKHIERIYTNGLTQNEVHSRLTALANTVDSRGWVIKNVNTNLYDPIHSPSVPNSDRLINFNDIPREVPSVDVAASDDILDELNNPLAQKLDQLVHASYDTQRQQIVEQLKLGGENSNHADQLPPPADYWFLNKPINVPKPSGDNVTFSDAPVVTRNDENKVPAFSTKSSEVTTGEKQLAEKLKANRKNFQAINYEHMKVIQPLGERTNQKNINNDQSTQLPPVTPQTDPAKMLLASRNDLNITTIGRIANKQDKQPNEVVISLHNHNS